MGHIQIPRADKPRSMDSLGKMASKWGSQGSSLHGVNGHEHVFAMSTLSSLLNGLPHNAVVLTDHQISRTLGTEVFRLCLSRHRQVLIQDLLTRWKGIFLT